MDGELKDARKHSHPSAEGLWPSKLFSILLLAAAITGFALAACNADTGSQESRVVGGTAGLGQTAASPVAVTSDQYVSEPQPARESGTPLVSNNTSDAAVSLTAEPGRNVGDVAHSFSLPSVSGSAFSLDAPSTFIIDKEGVIRFKQAGMSINDRPSAQQVLEQLRLLEG